MIPQRCGVISDSEMTTAAPRSELCAESKEAQGARRQLAAVKTLETQSSFLRTHSRALEPRRPPRKQHTKVVPVRRLRDEMRHLALDRQRVVRGIGIPLELLLHPK